MKLKLMLCILAVAALAIAGCSSDSDDATPAGTATAAAAGPDAAEPDGDGAGPDAAEPDGDGAGPDAAGPAAAQPDGEPVAGAHFVYANPYTFPDLDPSSAFSNENVLLQNVYETLTRLSNPDASDEVTGILAESWTSNEDSTEWTFKLRPGVTFHDGEPLTAEAVRASLQRTIDLDLGAAFILWQVESMEAVDELTLRIDLSFPAPLDLVMSSQYAVYIICPSALEQGAEWFNQGNACGTGPYEIESYDPAGSTILTRFDGYWGGWSENQVETVDMRLIEDPVLAEQLVRNGSAHYTYNLPFDVYDSLERESGIEVVRSLSMTNLFGLLNTKRLSSPVREALVLSFPYDDITESLYGGEAVRSRGIVPLTVWGSHPDLGLPETDLDRAAELLEDAGVTDLTVTFNYDAGTTEQQQIGEVWKANLASIGVDLVLDPLTWDARWERAKADPEEAQDVFTMFWFPTYVTPYDFLFSVFHSEEEPFFNLGYYANEEFDALINEADALSGTDRDAAIELFQQAQEILIEDHAAVFMLDVPAVDVIRTEFSGYISNPAYNDVVWFYDLRSAN